MKYVKLINSTKNNEITLNSNYGVANQTVSVPFQKPFQTTQKNEIVNLQCYGTANDEINRIAFEIEALKINN